MLLKPARTNDENEKKINLKTTHNTTTGIECHSGTEMARHRC